MVNEGIFYFMTTQGKLGQMSARTMGEVNRSKYVTIIISDTPFPDIGMEAVDEVAGFSLNDLPAKAKKRFSLKRGDVCTVVVDDPQKITGLVYQGLSRLMGRYGSKDTFHRFTKGTAIVLIDKNFVNFVSINGVLVTDDVSKPAAKEENHRS